MKIAGKHARVTACLLGIAGALFIMRAAVAQTAALPASSAQVEHLADLLTQVIPLGKIMAQQAAADPTWPLKEKASAVSTTQLACMRNEMSPAGWRRAKLDDAKQFAAAHPDSLADDIKLLDSGAAMVAGKFVEAGITAHKTGQSVDAKTVMKTVSPQQASAFMTMLLDPKYASLRDLAGLNDMFDLSKSSQENREMGRQKGASIAMKFTFRAMGDCGISPAALL